MIPFSYINVLLGMYPEERFCVDGSTLTVHYPHITITNGEDSFDIDNIYVRLTISDLGRLEGIIKGTTLTRRPRAPKYSHSHLPEGYIANNNMHNFCIGTRGNDNPFHKIHGELNRRGSSDNPELFERFMAMLEFTYLPWESLDGRPYNYISTIPASDYVSGGGIEAKEVLRAYLNSGLEIPIAMGDPVNYTIPKFKLIRRLLKEQLNLPIIVDNFRTEGGVVLSHPPVTSDNYIMFKGVRRMMEVVPSLNDGNSRIITNGVVDIVYNQINTQLKSIYRELNFRELWQR